MAALAGEYPESDDCAGSSFARAFRLEKGWAVDGQQESRISVIIPALNEAEYISRTIETVQAGFDVECLVVDGGSRDSTVSQAARAGARVLLSLRGRARQMNHGARQARGDILLFLHADSELPDSWAEAVRQTMKRQDIALGCFRFRVRERLPGIRLIEFGAAIRSKIFKRPYGDQGLFLRRSIFDVIGGYPEVPILEDLLLVRRALRKGRLQQLSRPLLTSGRRWKKVGIFRTFLLNQFIVVAAAAGADLQKLKRAYDTEVGLLGLYMNRDKK